MRKTDLTAIKDALLLALIHIQQIPTDSAPTKEIRDALAILDKAEEEADRHYGVLKKFLASIYEEEPGALLRPNLETVEMLRKEIQGAEQ